MAETSPKKVPCPICFREYLLKDVEEHANRCIFLNSADKPEEVQKRKRTPSPTLSSFITRKTGETSKNHESPPKRSKVFLNVDSCNRKETNQSVAGHMMVPTGKLKVVLYALWYLLKKFKFPILQIVQFSSVSAQNNTSRLDFTIPLAKQVQPKGLDDFFGQNQVLGKSTALRALLAKGEIPNMILWGPPGCGKTSLAGIIHHMCKSKPKEYKFVSMCAATSGNSHTSTLNKIACL